MPRNVVSIIICTRDRAESLRRDLRAVGETAVPADLALEVLVVDNGSLDRTRPVVRQAKLWGQAPRYLYEPRLGLSCARNAGMAAARGEVLLWTDDDVRPGRTWIEALCRPILDGRADAVAGRVKLPDYLERPWLQSWHRACLAVEAPTRGDFDLTGANMAFARRVLERVPAFDPELGQGALGSCEESLFSRQLLCGRLSPRGRRRRLDRRASLRRAPAHAERPDGCSYAAGTQSGVYRLSLEASQRVVPRTPRRKVAVGALWAADSAAPARQTQSGHRPPRGPLAVALVVLPADDDRIAAAAPVRAVRAGKTGCVLSLRSGLCQAEAARRKPGLFISRRVREANRRGNGGLRTESNPRERFSLFWAGSRNAP